MKVPLLYDECRIAAFYENVINAECLPVPPYHKIDPNSFSELFRASTNYFFILTL